MLFHLFKYIYNYPQYVYRENDVIKNRNILINLQLLLVLLYINLNHFINLLINRYYGNFCNHVKEMAKCAQVR